MEHADRELDLSSMRREYGSGGLGDDDLGTDPIVAFERWFAAAETAGADEPNAMALATVDADGNPDARIVLLKGVDHRGFAFFTNYGSAKGAQLEQNGYAALVFRWTAVERQVRVRGPVERVPAAESDAYFATRPPGSRIGAAASRQSRVIDGRAVLEAEAARLAAAYPLGDVPRPEWWGGYRVVPDVLEFWQGQPDRLHDRIRFRRTGSGAGDWRRERLSP